MVFPYKVRHVICICTLCIQTVSGRKYVKKLIVPLPICGIEIQERYWGINAFNFVIFILFESLKNIIKKNFFNLLRVSARIISGFTIFGKLSFSSNFKQECGLQFPDFLFLHPGQWTKLQLFFLVFGGHMACGILVTQPMIESTSPALKVWNLNHWTCQGGPKISV